MARDTKTTKASLKVVDDETMAATPVPPDGLGPEALRLWDEIVTSYAFDDPASTEILRQAVCAVDLAAKCREQVQRDGLMVKVRGQTKENPAAKIELTARSLSARLLARLGLDLEPTRSGPGRPAGAIG